MHRMDLSPNVGEDDLHAVVDGQLAADRHREVMAYLAVYPDAADRVSAFFRQRVELAALREGLSDGEPARELAGLEAALCQSLRQGQRARRRALGGGGLALVLAAVVSGWWLAHDRGHSAIANAAPASRGEQMALGHGSVDADPITMEAGDAAVLWLQAHLGGQLLKQPNLETLGLHFVGGSTLKGARGPAIRLVYTDDAGAAFALFVGVKQSGVGLAASMVPEGHISLSWQHEPLTFTLIAPQGSSRLGDIMRSASDLIDPAPVAADAALGGHAGEVDETDGDTTQDRLPTLSPSNAERSAKDEVSKSL
jgi:anti-sigma factor RsiW